MHLTLVYNIMLTIVYQSTVSCLDLEGQLKEWRKKRLFMNFKAYLVDCPIRFFFL